MVTHAFVPSFPEANGSLELEASLVHIVSSRIARAM